MHTIEQIGAYAGLASVVGLAILAALYFSQARDVRRLREWAGRAPERSAEQAAAALERLQEELVLALTGGNVAGFTCSFGVADTSDASSLEELLATADAALFRAKQAGRNRVLLAHAEV